MQNVHSRFSHPGDIWQRVWGFQILVSVIYDSTNHEASYQAIKATRDLWWFHFLYFCARLHIPSSIKYLWKGQICPVFFPSRQLFLADCLGIWRDSFLVSSKKKIKRQKRRNEHTQRSIYLSVSKILLSRILDIVFISLISKGEKQARWRRRREHSRDPDHVSTWQRCHL